MREEHHILTLLALLVQKVPGFTSFCAAKAPSKKAGEQSVLTITCLSKGIRGLVRRSKGFSLVKAPSRRLGRRTERRIGNTIASPELLRGLERFSL